MSLIRRVRNLPHFEEVTRRLFAYCRLNDWAGYDPYDALNSAALRSSGFFNSRLIRLALTQINKKSPINLRPLLIIPKTHNPKGIALFLSSFVLLRKVGLLDRHELIPFMAKRLLELRSQNIQYSAWGYSFDWQTRTRLVPKGSPNIICSTFAANALLDAYEIVGDQDYLLSSISTAEFILRELHRRPYGRYPYFCYTPNEPSLVHNANLLGAALLIRISDTAGIDKFVGPALEAARLSVSFQQHDGSWKYGEDRTQTWIDNFHTGFNLVALKRILEHHRSIDLSTSIRRGLDFYITHFFRKDGVPKYYNHSLYPIDIHSVAQSIITLTEFGDWDDTNSRLAGLIAAWGIENMLDEQGFFYFQKWPLYTVKIPYMRWSQAWMLFALSTLLHHQARKIGSNL